MQPLPKPKSALGWHRQLAPSASIKVSPLCLGAMNLGTAWGAVLGNVDEKASFELLDYFYTQGGNFIDTANAYHNGESEQFIGNWMKARGNRNEMVIATKYTTGYQAWKVGEKPEMIQSNFGGMNAKSLRHGLEDSLKRLQTDFVDVLYVHWWDASADIPEVMHALNDVVQQGKALYLGISDTPAWIVAKANEYARGHNLRPFMVYQGRWSASQRDMEREIIPMCRSEGTGIAPWAALGGGMFKTKAQVKAQEESGEGRKHLMVLPTEKDMLVTEKLDKIATRKGTAITSIALAYVMHKAPYTFPIVGGRKIEHLKGNVEALGIELSREEIEEIESAVEFDYGFPNNVMRPPGRTKDVSGEMTAGEHTGNKAFVNLDEVERPQPIKGGLHNHELGK